MSPNLFLRGLIFGFSIAAPVGPIGVLCIRRALAEGWRIGVMTGLGAATADAIYGSIAAFGLTLVADFLVHQSIWLKLLGGLFLCYLGVKTWLAKPALDSPEVKSQGLIKAYASTIFLTLTNPPTILIFAAVFAGLGLTTNGSDYLSAIALVAGVFCGSALWWLTLSSSVILLRSHFNPRRLQWLNRISGLILLVFGIISLSSIRS